MDPAYLENAGLKAEVESLRAKFVDSALKATTGRATGLLSKELEQSCIHNFAIGRPLAVSVG
jgi:hypothetical protein